MFLPGLCNMTCVHRFPQGFYPPFRNICIFICNRYNHNLFLKSFFFWSLRYTWSYDNIIEVSNFRLNFKRKNAESLRDSVSNEFQTNFFLRKSWPSIFVRNEQISGLTCWILMGWNGGHLQISRIGWSKSSIWIFGSRMNWRITKASLFRAFEGRYFLKLKRLDRFSTSRDIWLANSLAL